MEIQIDQAKLREVRSLLSGIKGGAETAIMRSINRSLTGVRTDATKEIAKEVNLTSKVIRSTMTLKKANKNNISASLASRHKAVPAYDKTKPWKIKGQTPGMHYGGKKLSKGFSFLFKKGRARSKFPNSFVATMPSSHTGIWIRTKKINPSGKAKIKEIYSSSPTEVFGNEDRMKPILKAASDRMEKNLDQQVNYLLGK